MSAHSFWTDAELHEEDDQLTRQDSASHIKLTPYEIDSENKMCRIKGSGKAAYEVSLEECTCIDFVKRVKPCKHMYRLAHILGVFKLEREPDVAKVAHHSSSGIVDVFVDTETGEIHKRPSPPKINKNAIPEEQKGQIDKFMKRMEDLSYEQITAISRSIPSSNSAYNEPWYKVTVDKELAQLLVDVELFRFLEATAMEKLNHVENTQENLSHPIMNSRWVLKQMLDIVDKEQTVNRRGPTKTWIKKLTTTLRDAFESINDQIFLLEATPNIGYRYATIYNKMSKLRIPPILCSACYAKPRKVYMEEYDYVLDEGLTHCYKCSEPFSKA